MTSERPPNTMATQTTMATPNTMATHTEEALEHYGDH